MSNKYYNDEKIPEILAIEISGMQYLVSQYYKYAKNKLSEQHILAIGKRYTMISVSYISIAQLYLREPESEDEMHHFNIYLNSLYINIFGILENLAWFIYYEKLYPEIKLDKRRISLFNKVFIDTCEKRDLKIQKLNDEYDGWVKDLKLKRDPIAHQVPLHVPYRVIVNAEQKEEYLRVEKIANEKLKSGDIHGFNEEMYIAHKIGEFIPKIWLVDSEAETMSFVDFRFLINGDIKNMNSIIKYVLNILF